MNIKTCRNTWHVGTGNDGPPEWDRFQLTKETLATLGLDKAAKRIEEETITEIGALWTRRLQIQSAS
jgi:hypothetical protein